MVDRQDTPAPQDGAEAPHRQVPGPDDPGARHDRHGAETTVSLGHMEPLEHEAYGGLSPDDQAAVAALPRTSALLIVQRGPNAGARFLLDAERTLAGRSVDADIFLDDVTVSRRHAEFVRELDDFVVRDVGSLNGTYVNRDRIERAVLRAGDEVQIGKYRLTFHPSPARTSRTGDAAGTSS